MFVSCKPPPDASSSHSPKPLDLFMSTDTSPHSFNYQNIRAGAIIVAAGTSQRMEGINKVFAPLLGKPLILHTLKPFLHCPFIQETILVLNRSVIEQGAKLIKDQGWQGIQVVAGGERRQDSVYEGLKHLRGVDWVIVHDGARPCLKIETLYEGMLSAQETGAATAAVPVTDSVKVVNDQGVVVNTLERDTLQLTQTPQIFRRTLLEEAFQHNHSTVADEATLVERLGVSVKTFPGSYTNIKVTTPADLPMAEWILRGRRN